MTHNTEADVNWRRKDFVFFIATSRKSIQEVGHLAYTQRKDRMPWSQVAKKETLIKRKVTPSGGQTQEQIAERDLPFLEILKPLQGKVQLCGLSCSCFESGEKGERRLE